MSDKKKNINSIGMFDFLKGVAMIAIILVHTVELCNFKSFAVINSFTIIYRVLGYGLMPMFFLISGYQLNARRPGRAIKQQSRFILLPYLVISLITIVLLVLVHYKLYHWLPGAIGEGKKQLIGFFLGFSHTTNFLGLDTYSCGPVWFVLALFISWVIVVLILQIKKVWIQYIIILASVFLGLFTSKYGFYPFCIQQALIINGYLYVGHIAKQKKIFERKIKPWTNIVLLITASIGVIWGEVNFSNNIYKFGIFDLIFTCAYCYWIVKLGLYLNKFNSLILNIVRSIGRYSYWIVFIHTIEILSLRWYEFVKLFGDHQGIAFVVQLILRCIIIFIGCIIWKLGGNWIHEVSLKRKQKNGDIK